MKCKLRFFFVNAPLISWQLRSVCKSETQKIETTSKPFKRYFKKLNRFLLNNVNKLIVRLTSVVSCSI